MSEPEGIKRNQHGWPYIKTEDGVEELYIRTSKLSSTLEDNYQLDLWHNRLTAVGLADNEWLLPEVRKNRHQTEELNGICSAAQRRAGADKKSAWGTVVHWFVECIDSGHNIIPEQAPSKVQEEAEIYGATVGQILDLAEDDLNAYQFATQELTTVALEQFMVCDELKSAGSADRIAHWDVTGEKHVTDLKTGRVDLSGLKFSIQMGIYSRSKLYRPPIAPWEDAEREDPGLNQKWGLVVHLPMQQGECEIYKVPIDKGYEAAMFAVELRDLRKVGRKWLRHVSEPDPVTVPAITEEEAKTIATMKEFASKYNIPMKGATKKADILAAIEAAEGKEFD